MKSVIAGAHAASCVIPSALAVGSVAMLDTDDGLVRHKLDVDEYHRMIDAGILHEDSRVELIDGELIDMAPISQDHAATVNGLNEVLVLACAGQFVVSTQNPVRLNRRNEPQPDFCVLRRRADRYRTGEPPGPGDVLLLVEVADSSLRFDRRVKLPLYASMGILEFWIVDLGRRVVDAYTGPVGDAYGNMATHAPDAAISLAMAPEITVNLAAAFA